MFGVINRHNSNSFRIKGWAITLVSAIFALTGTIKEPALCFIAIGPIVMFWILDSMFLANERCFISLYNCICDGGNLNVEKSKLRNKVKNSLDDESKIFQANNFSMNFIQFREIKRNNWWSVLFSYTIWWYYLALIILTAITYLGLIKLIEPVKTEPLKIETTIKDMGPIELKPLEINSTIKSVDTLLLKSLESKTKSQSNKTK